MNLNFALSWSSGRRVCLRSSDAKGLRIEVAAHRKKVGGSLEFQAPIENFASSIPEGWGPANLESLRRRRWNATRLEIEGGASVRFLASSIPRCLLAS